MYINPFVAGIVATVLFEALVIIGLGIVNAIKSNKK